MPSKSRDDGWWWLYTIIGRESELECGWYTRFESNLVNVLNQIEN